ncbi:MAG: glycoside hydrolase family 43 protein, partial [Thermoguttaceae bacterium]
KTRNTWAPEIFYDGETETYYIIWSSTVPGKFSPVEKGTSEGALDHRVYFTKTKDFKTFEPTKLYFDPGHNTIDAFLAKKDGKYSLFYKDETLYPEAKKIILETQGPTPEGPFAEGKRISAQDWVEGPGALRIGNDWIVYYDCYRDGKYGAVRSRDGGNGEWENVEKLISFPKGTRHGTPFEVDKETYERLVKKFGVAE